MNTTATTAPDTSAADAARERMSGDLKALVGDAQRLLDDASRYDDVQLARLKQRLREELDHLRTRFADVEAAAGLQLRQAARHTDEAVHGHPYAAMGLAAAAGLLLGVLIGRR